ncbi:MAG: NAD(P)-dependent alcohol dehydrogenase [Thermoplasmatota archaeon]
MKAMRYHRYGGAEVLQLEDVPMPEPGPGQVRLAVRAASVNPYEFHFLRGDPLFMRLITGLRRPKEPGIGKDVAGVVDAVGSGVTDFAPGDEVFGSGDGSYAEFCLAPVAKLAHKPASLSFEEAAALPMAGYTGLQALDQAGVGAGAPPGKRVLVNGASGGIGHLVVQMAKAMGAHVTATCKTANVAWVKELGADRVIDYAKASLLDGPDDHDAIIDMVVNHPLRALVGKLAPGGTYAWVGAAKMGKVLGPLPKLARLQLMRTKDRRAIVVNAKALRSDLERMAAWADAGQLRPTIEQVLGLEQAGEGIVHVERGHSKGKTVIQVAT